jgi:hypothetical protein
MTAPHAYASGNIYVSGTSCPSNSSYDGYTTVNWSVTSGEPDDVAVSAAVTPGPPYTAVLFAAARSGSQSADWLAYGDFYVFTLMSNVSDPYSEFFFLGSNYLGEADVQC